jgi:hypothetical protein
MEAENTTHSSITVTKSKPPATITVDDDDIMIID